MREMIRRHLPLVIAVAMVITVASVPTVAQQFEPAKSGANAGRVDGLHAIKSTGQKNKRKNKLVAFSGAGYIPANSIKGKAATLTKLGATTGAVNEADNPVHWTQIQGVPAAVVRGDATTSTVVFETPAIAVGATGAVVITWPVNIDIETSFVTTAFGTAFAVDVTGGTTGYWFGRSADGTALVELYVIENIGAVASTVKLRSTVWNETYVSPAAAKKQIKVRYFKSVKNAKNQLRKGLR